MHFLLKYVCVCSLSRVQLSVTPRTVALWAPLSVKFPRLTLEWVAFPPPGNLPNLGIEPASLVSPVLAGRFFTTSATWEALQVFC